MVESPEIKIDKTTIKIMSGQILADCIEADETISAELITNFSKSIQYAKLIYKKELNILLFEKTK